MSTHNINFHDKIRKFPKIPLNIFLENFLGTQFTGIFAEKMCQLLQMQKLLTFFQQKY